MDSVCVADASTLKTRITEAEAALHVLLSDGRGVTEYREADGRFIRKDPAQLRAYIASLKQELAAKTGGSVTRARFRRAL